jgi:hypothetical protein
LNGYLPAANIASLLRVVINVVKIWSDEDTYKKFCIVKNFFEFDKLSNDVLLIVDNIIFQLIESFENSNESFYELICEYFEYLEETINCKDLELNRITREKQLSVEMK